MREVLGKQKTLQQRYGNKKFDFFETDPKCVQDIVDNENLKGLTILENSAGNGRIAKVLRANGNKCYTVDIEQREFPLDLNADFLLLNNFILLLEDMPKKFDCAVYNPPFALLEEFIEKTWEFTDRQIIFCRLQCLESKRRYNYIYRHGYLKKLYVYINRVTTNAPQFVGNTANSICFCWLVLDKNNKSEPVIKWLSGGK